MFDLWKLHAYQRRLMRKTGFRGNYRLEPLNSSLFAIDAEEIEVEKPKEKIYSIYGEYGQ